MKNHDLAQEKLVQEDGRNFRVDTRAYTNREVFEAEMQRIFERTWVYVAHESEIQKPGDFKTTTVGRNPVIVSRAQHDGRLYVLLNACRHRGNAVARESYGSGRSFRCPYHGWVYSGSGELTALTNPRGYPPEFAAELGGLIRLRTETYRGLIFATFNEALPPLVDHLAAVRKYIDLWADLSPDPEFQVERPHHYAYQGNWKFQAENAVDGWHARFVHESAFQTVAEFGGPAANTRSTVGRTRGFEHGFAILERPGISQGMNPGQIALYRSALERRHSAERTELLWHVRHIFLFPNVILFDNLIRVIHPVSPEETIVTSQPLIARGLPEDCNRTRLLEVQSRLATAGMVSLDDLEVFASNQTGLRGDRMRHVVLSHGMGQDKPVEGSSELVGEDTSELPQRSLYRQWSRLMSAAAQ
jgi:phenylpropionate dioxygenase-like ring-hydroxylating dioxygenase large terminal subunit